MFQKIFSFLPLPSIKNFKKENVLHIYIINVCSAKCLLKNFRKKILKIEKLPNSEQNIFLNDH